jgi:hypothetical protein
MKAIDEPRMLAMSVHRAIHAAAGGAAVTPSMQRSYGRAKEVRQAAISGRPPLRRL